MRLRWLPALVAVAVLAAACGRGDNGSSSPEDDGTPRIPAADPATTGADGDFGDLEGVCGPGDASGETDQGVTDTGIRVATFADPGFSGRPGLNQEIFDTAQAFVEWCNEAGGILGRELRLDLRDAAIFDYLQRVLESCDVDFAMVGGGSVLDEAGAAQRVRCGLPDIAGFAVSTLASEADLTVQPVPNPVYELGVGHYRAVEQLHPEATQAVGLITGAVPTTLLLKDRYVEGMRQLGWNVVYEGTYNAAGEANWKPFVEAMRGRGVRLFQFVGESQYLAALQKAMDDTGWYPEATILDANLYDRRYVEEGGDSIRDTYVRLNFWPLEEAGDNPATQAYLDLLEQYRPGTKPALLGMQGLSAWLLFATAAKACGSELTRDCLLEQAAVSEWTGGGLHGPTDPAANHAAECFVLMEAGPDGFRRVTEIEATDGIYRCSAEDTLELTGDYGEGAKQT